MVVKVEILADSISRTNNRITTFMLEYPRFIHAEMLVHRVFSKNSASSRAIPIDKMIQKVIDDPAMPVYWGKNQKGMSAGDELSLEEIVKAKEAWLKGRDKAVESVRELQALGMHKQISNRIIEPWINIKVVLTGTEFDGFFALRCHKDAQPEIQELAVAMREAMRSSVPKFRAHLATGWSSWHLPLVSEEELSDTSDGVGFKNLIRSVARCARTSYDKVEGGLSDFENDLRVFRQLGESSPAHESPFEHQAFPALDRDAYYNFKGWQNFRWHMAQNPRWFKSIVEQVST